MVASKMSNIYGCWNGCAGHVSRSLNREVCAETKLRLDIEHRGEMILRRQGNKMRFCCAAGVRCLAQTRSLRQSGERRQWRVKRTVNRGQRVTPLPEWLTRRPVRPSRAHHRL